MTHLATIDYLLMLVYFMVVLLVGWKLRRSTRTSTDFFLSGRSIPTPLELCVVLVRGSPALQRQQVCAGNYSLVMPGKVLVRLGGFGVVRLGLEMSNPFFNVVAGQRGQINAVIAVLVVKRWVGRVMEARRQALAVNA